MTEPILMALVQLFAIVAATARKQASENSRLILESYLREQLNSRELEEYLKLFDELLFFHQPSDESAEINPAVIQNKISSICQKISKDLPNSDRIIVFIKFTEFLEEICRNETTRGLKEEISMLIYTGILRSAFNIPEAEYQNALDFVLDPFGQEMQMQNILIIDGNRPGNQVSNILSGSISTAVS